MLPGLSVQAQSSRGISYQAVARQLNGEVLPNQNISVRMGIIQGSASGPVQYSENHAVRTNEFGLFTLQIGNGSAQSGNYSTINWALGPHFVKVETDFNGGSNYLTMGTFQLFRCLMPCMLSVQDQAAVAQPL